MFDVIYRSVSELEKKDSVTKDNYQQFQKNYHKYTEDAKKAGLIKSPTKEELFGLPYKGR